jgi:flagellar hook-basal body complex protein FliE
MAGITGISGVTSVKGPLSGGGGAGGIGGISMPKPAGGNDGGSFADMLKEIVVKQPSRSHATADGMAAEFAAGGNVDPHQLAIATAKAGIELQMSTRTISQAATGIRTLMQMQI